MDKDTRNAIERATQRARKLLEEDFAAQLEGEFDVHRDGAVAEKAGSHLSTRQAFQRERVVAVIEHKRAAGMGAADAARDYLRDAAFTTLNRFVALKMLEARELVQECITKGEQSGGYREFCGMAPGLALLPESAGYRLYIESLFDELSTEVKVLFDRRDLSSVLWPKRTTFEKLLEILNGTELSGVWSEDETIGWVYQFFNGDADRKAARYDEHGKPKAPQNSRELAVRNQFFTPRYVVQFLTDNTLGRIWYEMRGTKTVLAETCEYMVRKPGEEFALRAKKDPRDLRVLDPACGSGHFLLYAFDLLLAIYEEAYADPESPRSEATGRTLAEDYPTIESLRTAVPGLVLAYNLHGVDIDPRCAQIAQLALWMRAQKAYRDFDVARAARAQIRRSNIVVAEPLVADAKIVEEFVAKLGDIELGRVFTSLVESLNLAGDLGLLLRVEHRVARHAKASQNGDLFAPPEDHIRAALDRFVREEGRAASTRQRLFAEDASHGMALLGIAESRFDAVLMNPPFGFVPSYTYDVFAEDYRGAHSDISSAFVRRGLQLAPHGRVGAIVSRTVLVATRQEAFRRDDLIPYMDVLLDLGPGVMDGALVDTVAFVLDSASASKDFLACDARPLPSVVPQALRERFALTARAQFAMLPASRILYGLPPSLFRHIAEGLRFEPVAGTAREGQKTFDDFRFLRLRWEVPRNAIGWDRRWRGYAKGGEFAFYYRELPLLMNWGSKGAEQCAVNVALNGGSAQVRQASNYWGTSGATYSKRSAAGFSARILPREFVFATKGPAVLPHEGQSGIYLLGWLNSRLMRFLIQLQANASDFMAGILKALPWVEPTREARTLVESAVSEILRLERALSAYTMETSYWFCFPLLQAEAVFGIERTHDWAPSPLAARRRECMDQVDATIDALYAVESSGWLDDLRKADEGSSEPVEADEDAPTPTTDALRTLVSWAVGRAFGRFRSPQVRLVADASTTDPFASPDAYAPGESTEGSLNEAILVDDEGHPHDIVVEVRRHLGQLAAQFHQELPLSLASEELRPHFSREFFDVHARMYSKSRRKAPIYWQLSTSSATYSVWLYIHAFGKDTLFRVQNDYAAPKLAHEERRLKSLTSALRDGATAVQRKAMAVQEELVEELRAFLDEVRRVAPLWSPNLDDGVIINFAPLWRLVPQNKAWQKELKSTWDALCEGKYDWAHLAMHLWPERVVLKCAKDRSLAIAHGLEDVFWIEDRVGKWTARKTPARSVDELVRERTSPAVKSALKGLLDAPAALGAAKKTRKGRANA